MEQVKLKRAGAGLRACDPDRATPGYTLFTPMSGEGTVYLVDLNGDLVHAWKMPHPPGLYGRLTPRGTLLYNGQTSDDPESAIAGARWKGGAILEADWLGNVLWEVGHPDHHHDSALLRNGNLLLLCAANVPAGVARRVRGDSDGEVLADYLVEMTTGGRIVWEWRSWEHLDPEEDKVTVPIAGSGRTAWTHGNSVTEMPDGNIVVGFRDISTVVILDRASGDVVWKLGPPVLAQQHAPTPLPDGNLLIFDNGARRADSLFPFSRVIEVEPETREIVWEYREPNPVDFFSPYVSNAQRLPGGNTLICEGAFGRIFEVAPEGGIVWEYVNPYFASRQPGDPPSNAVFRAYRYGEDEVSRVRDASPNGPSS